MSDAVDDLEHGMESGDESEGEYQMERHFANGLELKTESSGMMEESGMDFRAGKIAPQDPNMPPPQLREGYDPRGNRISANTGPKGVKADFEEAKANLRDIRMMAKMRQFRDVDRMANGPSDLSGFKEHVGHTPAPKTRAEEEDEDSSSDSFSDEDSDDEAFQRYKLERIQQVQNSLPSFGTHDRIETNNALAGAVKNVHELVYVLVHVYENNSPACTSLNLCMESLAPQFTHIKFCRIRSSDCMKNFNRQGLPTLMIYRGGKPVKTFIRVHDTIPPPFSDLKLAQFLQKEGILMMPGSNLFNGVKKPSEEAANTIRTSRQAYYSDDEDY